MKRSRSVRIHATQNVTLGLIRERPWLHRERGCVMLLTDDCVRASAKLLAASDSDVLSA